MGSVKIGNEKNRHWVCELATSGINLAILSIDILILSNVPATLWATIIILLFINCPSITRLEHRWQTNAKIRRHHDQRSQRNQERLIPSLLSPNFLLQCLDLIHHENVMSSVTASLVYSQTGYDITRYFQSAFMDVRKNGRKCLLQKFRVEFMENGLSKGHNILHIYRGQPVSQSAGYDVTSCFQSAAKCN